MNKITLTAGNATEKRVLAYLEENASPMLAAKINAGTKTLAGAMSYAKGEAKKLAKGEGCICVDDATVFGWIIHFFEEDDVKESAPRKVMTAGPAPKTEPKPQPKAKAKPEPKPAAEDAQLSMIDLLFK